MTYLQVSLLLLSVDIMDYLEAEPEAAKVKKFTDDLEAIRQQMRAERKATEGGNGGGSLADEVTAQKGRMEKAEAELKVQIEKAELAAKLLKEERERAKVTELELEEAHKVQSTATRRQLWTRPRRHWKRSGSESRIWRTKSRSSRISCWNLRPSSLTRPIVQTKQRMTSLLNGRRSLRWRAR